MNLREPEYKVLALDLDGTVLTDDHTIHPAVKLAIHEAQKVCHVVIVTGRHHTAAKPYYDELGLTTPIICCNGTYVYDYRTDQVLEHNAISKDDALQFIELATEFQMALVMYVTNEMTYSKKSPIHYMQALEAWAKQYPKDKQPQIRQIDSFNALVEKTDYVWKFVVEGEPSSVQRLSDQPWIQQRFNGERSWSNRIDFAAKGNNKGARLADYVQQLGYDATQVMAVGDNHNDISMLEYAGLGVAMENADDTVKSNAQVTCPTDNNNDGLARLIREKIKG
ncbi:HAD family hydrolase [Vibrio sp. 10N.286.49.C2]|uniref:Cof-type HAD-IIB family hydrolase n=1 Tax=unclassified Vibrio TaxID=2614977 RepID=UPI000C81725E|nr:MULTISPECIES: Cof-type HAD-IIB family hydrolase [unclassified Vibrio]PMH43410.1 HAD family hydrolase [Vibrio sp. 10N.286.49.C2]PMH57062.1 HAD family hydrolase [Vibrio sp. 10N.286.49.B1]PMH78542.1 HAD family hydrolase [Vibrio sp. 10N.286.48.B7]